MYKPIVYLYLALIFTNMFAVLIDAIVVTVARTNSKDTSQYITVSKQIMIPRVKTI